MQSPTLPNNQEDREVYLRDHAAAHFIDAVAKVRRDNLDTLIFTIGAFVGEPELLYVALDYANHSGVDITIPTHHGSDR